MPVPEVDQTGYIPVGVTIHRSRAPMPLVMDNFSEVEHTVAMHPALRPAARYCRSLLD
jgi:hypothetical protein